MVETREGQMEKKMNILDFMTDKQIAEVVRAMPDEKLARFIRKGFSWEPFDAPRDTSLMLTQEPPARLPPDTTGNVPPSSTGMQAVKKEHTNAFRARIIAAFADHGGKAKIRQLRGLMYDKVTGREVDEKRLVKSLQEMKAKGKLTYSNGVWYCT